MPDAHPVTMRTVEERVCAWPAVQRMPEGALIAFGFNQPCHGKWEGDVDCWLSEDDGINWAWRGRVAPHAPGTNRMNHAAGLTTNGDLVALVSGWDHRPPEGQEPTDGFKGAHTLRPMVCRSTDGGRRWVQDTEAFPMTDDGTAWIPFGAILPGADGALRACAYGGRSTHCVMFRSDDDGRTWTDPAPIEENGNETAPLHLGDGVWLAAARMMPKDESGIKLFRSEDDGRTWAFDQRLTEPHQHPGHLLRLADGRLLLTFGDRLADPRGVGIRFSDDDGKTWRAPQRLATVPGGDCGYPATTQVESGRCVTLYYTAVPAAWQYEMRAALWNPDNFPTD